ncbi:putative peptidase m66 protein [Phaeoacremonium minimum UCRPA7]|uniref:Putative peptidase m66 protein n=1 Tax=Phaeoacremonium minimum (strain UCR-PA7) TaxID=1286976 RepID=R8BVD8_PHAM7|nr:putative peptidase m66 protein [Phaeoacremonium minimum UCRPA7]EOO03285.1 putative peptidase m66 protein [Phaeoacremonium minimum UCRPA7]
MSGSDLKDLVGVLERLREAIDLTSPLFTRRSTGIEITQSVQYYHSASHLTDTNDRASDNAVTPVAYKPAVVRAYVRPGFGLPSDAPVGGTLKVERKSGIIGPWREVRTLSPWRAPTVTPLDDTYADERGTFLNSLNFRIDAADFAGNMRLTLQLDTGETRTTNVTAYLVQALRVRVILVSYQGPSTANPAPGTTPPTLNLAAPTLADAQATASTAFRMMPVQQTGSFAVAGTLTWQLPLDDAVGGAGGCSANWNSLLASLDKIRQADGNRADVVYYGLLPVGIPVGGVVGCGSGGLGTAASGNARTFVHEIGHGYGFAHTPSGNVGTPDPNYPVYEPYPSASIGEYGCDIQDGTVYSPAVFRDYMSYAANRWMSLYQHARLIDHPRLAPYYIRERNPLDDIPILIDPKPWWWPDPPGPDPPPWEQEDFGRYKLNPVISVRGAIDELGGVSVDSVARVNATQIQHGPEISWNALLVGAAGDVASRARLTRIISHGGGCGCGCSGSGSGSKTGKDDPDRLPLEFVAMLPNTELGTNLQILDRGGKEAWTRSAPDELVCFAKVEAKLVNETVVRLDWDLDAGEATDIWAQYSSDEGKTWHGLTVGLCGGSAEVDASGVPAGLALLRLLAHDGFSTATSDPVNIKVPERAPYPAILYPVEDEVVAANTEFEVLGSAVDQGGIPIDDERLEWLLDGQPLKLRGRAVKVLAKEGSHKLTLRAIAKHNSETTVAFSARDIRRSVGG